MIMIISYNDYFKPPIDDSILWLFIVLVCNLLPYPWCLVEPFSPFMIVILGINLQMELHFPFLQFVFISYGHFINIVN